MTQDKSSVSNIYSHNVRKINSTAESKSTSSEAFQYYVSAGCLITWLNGELHQITRHSFHA